MAKTQRWRKRNARQALSLDRVPLRFLHFERQKVIYCPIAKNSSTFFKQLLIAHGPYAQDFESSDLDVHRFVQAHRDLRVWDFAKLTAPGYLKFVVIREPLERIVSAYLNKFVSAKRNHRVANLATTGYIELVNNDFDPTQFLNFRQFVRLLCHQADAEMDQHWRPQTSFLRQHVGNFEWLVPQNQLAKFFPVLEQRLETTIRRTKTKNRIEYTPLTTTEDVTKWQPQRLRNKGLYPDKDSFLTPDLRQALLERYADDLTLWEQANQCFADRVASS